MNGKNAEELVKYIFERLSQGFEEIFSNEKDEIYSYSFFVYNYEDDLRRPYFILGYNTIQKYQSEIKNALNPKEAKWNYAFWLQNSIIEIGTEKDSKGKQLLSNWIQELGLSYTDEEEDENFEACLEKGGEIGHNFYGMLIWVVQQLQTAYEFNVPILIHGFEYFDEVGEQNVLANGEEKASEFMNWINEMYE